jgi:hypothetical protein
MINTSPTGMMAAAARAYMQPKSQNQGMSGEGSPESESSQAIIPDPEELKAEWNKFVNWMHTTAKIKVKDPKTGKITEEHAWKNPKLDKGGIGNELFEQYRKETGSKLSKEDIPVVRRLYGEHLAHTGKKILAGQLNVVDLDSPEKKFLYYDINNPTSEESQKAMAIYRKSREWYDANEKTETPDYVGSQLSSLSFPEFGGKYKGEKAGSMGDLKKRERIQTNQEGMVL